MGSHQLAKKHRKKIPEILSEKMNVFQSQNIESVARKIIAIERIIKDGLSNNVFF